MRSKHFLGFLIVGSAVAAATGVGCGGSDTTTTGTGGKTTTTTTTSSTTSSSKAASTGAGGTTTGTGGTGGMGGGMGHDFATAVDIMVNDQNPTSGQLLDPVSTSDFYKFMGKKGESILFQVQAKTLIMGGDAFDPAVVDVVVNLYDGKQTLIAQQDDPWPRNSNDPVLFTLLPADDTYYVEIAECNKAFGSGCADATKIMTYDYTLQALDLGGPGDTAEGATDSPAMVGAMSPAVKYPKGANGYGLGLIDGAFTDASDVDTYTFAVPADVALGMNGERAHLEMWLQTTGSNDGNGSSADATYWVEDAAAPGAKLALLDQKNYGDNDQVQNGMNNGPALLSIPVKPGSTYNLFIKHGGAAKMSAEKNDFYYAQLFAGTFFYGTVEAETAKAMPNSNDILTNAEVIPASNVNMTTMATTYAIDGELPAGDVADFFSIDVPAGLKTFVVQCDAARIGSGLAGFKAELQDGTGKTVAGSALVDSATTDVHTDFQMPPAIPAAATKLYFKASASGQTMGVAGTQYRCFVSFNP